MNFIDRFFVRHPKFYAWLRVLLPNIILIIFAICVLCGCSTIKEIPVQTVEKVVVRDSVIFRDSVVYIPQERIVEIVPQLDTLFMDIETASSKAYLDTTNMLLRGELKSKKKEVVKYQTIIEYRDRIDTVYIKEPQPYEVIKKETIVMMLVKK